MRLRANKQNLRKHAQSLLGNEYSEETARALIRECLTGFVRSHGHISHDRCAHLDRIGALLHTHGTEGMLLNKHGEDMAGTCSMREVVADIQYCNAGDTYALTILYYNGKLFIGDWGSIVETLN